MYEKNEVKELIPEVIRNSLWITLANMKQPSFKQRFVFENDGNDKDRAGFKSRKQTCRVFVASGRIRLRVSV